MYALVLGNNRFPMNSSKIKSSIIPCSNRGGWPKRPISSGVLDGVKTKFVVILEHATDCTKGAAASSHQT